MNVKLKSKALYNKKSSRHRALLPFWQNLCFWIYYLGRAERIKEMRQLGRIIWLNSKQSGRKIWHFSLFQEGRLSSEGYIYRDYSATTWKKNKEKLRDINKCEFIQCVFLSRPVCLVLAAVGCTGCTSGGACQPLADSAAPPLSFTHTSRGAKSRHAERF